MEVKKDTALTLNDAKEKLNQSTSELVTNIVDSSDTKELQDLTNLFNLAQTKKAVLRAQTYNDLLDGITEQMKLRVTKRADQFSNKDLLDYVNVITNAAEKAQKQITGVDAIPIIQVNTQNNTVVVGEKFDKESRQRILAAAGSILEKLKASGNQVSPEVISMLTKSPQLLKPEDEIEDSPIIDSDSTVLEVQKDSAEDNSFVVYNNENEEIITEIQFNSEDDF